MKDRKLLSVLLVGMFIAALVSATIPAYTAQAQTCGIPGTPPCLPPKKRPTAIPPTPTFTPTPTSTSTSTPTARATPCAINGGGNPSQVCPTPPCFSISGAGNGFCTPTPQAGIPNTENGGNTGSRSISGNGGIPGPLGMLLAGLIIVVCFGLIIVVRRFGNGNRKPVLVNPSGDAANQFDKIEDDLNPQPLPPKGMGDGSDQFGKVMPNGSNQFRKAWDQYGKLTPSEKQPGLTGDAANQFDKDFPNQIGGDGGLTGNEIGGSGGEQL